MSDFYEGRMIPLKFADAAVISCNKEIEKLQIENARLQAEVEALKLGSLLTAVDVLQFINLKAEVERLRKAGDAMAEIDACFDGKTPIMSGVESILNIVKRWKKL